MNDPYEGSPLEGLSDSVPEGGLALVVGRPGIGKTAILVHAALAALLRGQQVLHVALRDSVDHVRAHYDELLRVLASRGPTAHAALQVERGRMVHTTRGGSLSFERLANHLNVLADAADFVPGTMLFDGVVEGPDLTTRIAAIAGVVAERHMRGWVAVDTEAPLPAELFARATLVVRLVPAPDRGGGDEPRLQLQRVHGEGDGVDLPALLDPASLFVVSSHPTASLPPDQGQGAVSAAQSTLYTGGAAGSEATFGEVAGAWGVREVAFTFEGHLQERTVGRQELSPRELAMGDVSLTYVSKRLNRSYHDRAGLIRGVLQTLWHMVSRSQQVFVIGEIQADGTVTGGTGWGVELARMWGRELWVFDQAREAWHRWADGWVADRPRITAAAFCGTGTRKITDAGRSAIEALFRDSFGPG